LVFDLDDQRGADDDGARDHDDEDRRPIAGIDEGIIEPAGFAVRPQRQKTRIEFSLAAARTAAGDAAQRALGNGGEGLVLHSFSFVSRTRCSVLPAMRSIVRYAAPQSRDPCRLDGPRTSSAPRR